jgi:glucose-6-phosphate 1-dehydrogenase
MGLAETTFQRVARMNDPPYDLVLFGASGDLALRKLLPALYCMVRHGSGCADANIVATAREPMSSEQYRALIDTEVPRFLAGGDFDPAAWSDFRARVHYVQVDALAAADFPRIGALLSPDATRARVFYLATAPSLFTSICRNLAAAGLVHPDARVVLEKPLGRDRASAREINEAVGAIFREDQVYRIDHYLGKETVQNLLALRFGNTLFEPLWSRAWIHDVQLTIAEQVGVENRGEFYDATGALRDMVQNHLLQCLCIVAMEPPASIDADAVRDAKLQVLRALRPFDAAEVRARTVRGQYRAGAIEGQPVAGYPEERGIPAGSRTETFVAIKTEVDNWRWAGTPFYLRTGKRMPERRAEIVVNFRAVPHSIFDASPATPRPNQLVIRLQPDDGLSLQLNAKTPGDRMALQPMPLDLSFSGNGARRLDAYERLLMDVIRGRLALFVRRDELDAAWMWIEPILAGWQQQDEAPKPYTAGTWGPAASSALVGRDGRAWQEEA